MFRWLAFSLITSNCLLYLVPVSEEFGFSAQAMKSTENFLMFSRQPDESLENGVKGKQFVECSGKNRK